MDKSMETPGIAPLIQCQPTDINGLSYGYGNLQRIFLKAQDVTLTAPESFGRLQFSHWDISDIAMRSAKVHDRILKLDVNKSIQDLDLRCSLRIGCVYKEVTAPRRIMATLVSEYLPKESSYLRLRNISSLKDGVWIGKVPIEEDFEVLDGPIENEGLIWTKILYKGMTGWYAEQTTPQANG